MKLIRYKGKLVDELTKEELLTALEQLEEYYEDRLRDKDRIISLYEAGRAKE